MDYQRRLVLYRFAPSFIGYGRAYTNDQPPRWPASYYEVRRCIAVNGARERAEAREAEEREARRRLPAFAEGGGGQERAVRFITLRPKGADF